MASPCHALHVARGGVTSLRLIALKTMVISCYQNTEVQLITRFECHSILPTVVILNSKQSSEFGNNLKKSTNLGGTR
jgi:hypothetical protein